MNFVKQLKVSRLLVVLAFKKDINGTISEGYQDIEIPKITLDNKGIELALTLFNKYKKYRNK